MLKIGRNVLTERLGRLVDEGLLERVQYSERPTRYEYRLTNKGRDLWPVVAAMTAWGDPVARRRQAGTGRPASQHVRPRHDGDRRLFPLRPAGRARGRAHLARPRLSSPPARDGARHGTICDGLLADAPKGEAVSRPSSAVASNSQSKPRVSRKLGAAHSSSVKIKPRYVVVSGLEEADELVDKLLLSRAIVRLTRPLPRWWRCELSRLSQALDRRWRTGLLDEGPMGCSPPCERRPSRGRLYGFSSPPWSAASYVRRPPTTAPIRDMTCSSHTASSPAG
jgi:hypothetical protein